MKKIILILTTIFLPFMVFGQSLITTYEYDELNRLVKVDYPNGQRVEYAYDALGNRISRTVSQLLVIRVSIDPEGAGTVSGAGNYEPQSDVTLTATANEGYQFVNWTEDGVVVSTEETYSFTAVASRQLVANFEESYVTQITFLVQGWNWFSTYIDMNQVDAIAMLEEALGDYGVTIVTFDDQAEYLGDGFWLGLEDYQLTNGEMILIEVSEDCTLTLEGPVVDPSTVEITINPEWNYIGYPLAVEMTVEEAMSAFEAEFGDGIANFEGLTEYLGEWMGDFETLVPGQGYMYYSYSDVPKTLFFSTGSKAKVGFPRKKRE